MLLTRSNIRHPRGHKRGQAMIEFALVAPVMFLLLIGVIEFGFMTFDVGSSRYAVSEAARAIAAGGDGTPDCKLIAGCERLHPPPPPPTPNPCDADCGALVAINNTALGTTSLVRVNSVDITLLRSDGTPSNPLMQNHYIIWNGTANDFGGTSCSCTYTANTRGVVAGHTDYVSVAINYTYIWRTQMFLTISPNLNFTSTYYVHLEPRRFQ